MTETGIVLTGGGARAAYQVGVLRAISDMYPDWDHPFRVIVGTSAGAINALSLASGGGIFRHNVYRLEKLWSSLTVDDVYRNNPVDIFRNMTRVSRRMIFGGESVSEGGSKLSLLNNSPLRALMSREMDFQAIQQTIADGNISAVGVNACGYSTGQNICFFDGHESLKSWTVGQRAGTRTTLGLEHVMASSAIPTVFPPVRLLDISPSERIDELASEYMLAMPLMLRKLAGSTDRSYASGGSLASYLLFDHGFCTALIKLGYQDAQSHAKQIERFFAD